MNIIRLCTLNFLVACFLGSCDHIDAPVIEQTSAYDEETYGPAPSFENATTAQQIKRVLIEDFTGQQCGNCPAAAVEAEAISSANPGRIDILAIHSGSLAVSNGGHYTNEFESEEGDAFFDELFIPVNPIGRVNRAPVRGESLLPAQWAQKVSEQLALDSEAAIQMIAEFDSEKQKVNIHVFSEMLSSFEGKVKMTVLVAENKLEGPQLNYSVGPKFIDEEYEFEDVLRGSVNGAFGVTVFEDPSIGDTAQRDYTYSWNSSWIATNCSILVVLYDDETGRILNCQSAHL